MPPASAVENEAARAVSSGGPVGVDRGRELVVGLPTAAANRVLEQRDRLGVPLVVLPVTPPRVQADDRQQVARRTGVGARVAHEHTLGDLRQADAADPRRGAGEVPVDERRRETDRLEDLRAAIRGDGRDAHLRDHLQQALADRLHRPLGRLVPRERDSPLVDELTDRREHQYGFTAAAP